jgi:hypothetical protein
VSLAIVVATGLIGLYLYLLLPKAGLRPFRGRLAELEPLLPGLTKSLDEFVRRNPVTQLPADASFLRSIFTIPWWVAQARMRRRGLHKAAKADRVLRLVAKADPRLAQDLVAELADLAAAEVDTNAGSAMMRSWRSLHRFLAILMLLSVSVHIAVAWYFGFRWIF